MKILQTLLNIIPIVGDIKENIQSSNGTKIGTINVKQLGFMIVRIILLIAFIKGVFSLEDLKELLNIL